MSNDRDVEAAFDLRTENGQRRTDEIHMYFACKALWSVQMIGGILHLDQENGVRQDDDYVLLEWGFAGQMLWSDQLIITNNKLFRMRNHLDDPRHSHKDFKEFEKRVQSPFSVRFADIPQVPANI